MFDFPKLMNDIAKIYSKNQFEDYLKSYFSEIENYFNEASYEEVQSIKFDIEDLLYDLSDKKLIQTQNNQIINAFLLLLAEKFIQTSMIGAITIIVDYIPNGGMKMRLDASKLYLKVNNIAQDYFVRVEKILDLLESSAKEDEYNLKAIKSFLYFIENAFLQFKRVSNEKLGQVLVDEILKQKTKNHFLQDTILEPFFNSITNLNIENTILLVQNLLDKFILKKQICNLPQNIIQIESSQYTQILQTFKNPIFEDIRDISYKYIQSIGDPQELYDRLQRGEKIIDDEKLLYKYIVSFGGKHKLKLDSAYELIIDKLQNQKFDIVDWGCGQATATMVLLDYAKKKNITLDIENITLIEPSSLALRRGLLHIDTLKQKEYNIKAINSDLDCLDSNEIIQSKNKTLHLFSNILDVESFALDNRFFKKVSNTIQNDVLFVCISPNRNDKLNNRLDLFYKFFDNNFDTELLSSRDTDVGNATRYEKIFEVKYTEEAIIEEKRHEIATIQKSYHLDIIDELNQYSNFVVPILDINMLEQSLSNDPEYTIYKIRKVADAITSKIYSRYESNSHAISFNDKIRYLTHEKKVFNKTITNYAQTIRTIGNRGVHDEIDDISKLKLDAHLIIIALVCFLKELQTNKII